MQFLYLRPFSKYFEYERAMCNYTRIHNFCGLRYENKCIRTSRARFPFLRTNVQGVLGLQGIENKDALDACTH
jgi:hypothetical protein